VASPRAGAATLIAQLALSSDGADLLLQQPDLFVRSQLITHIPFQIMCKGNSSNARLQIPQLVDIVCVGNQTANGDAIAAIAACVVSCPCGPMSLLSLLLPRFQNLCSNDAAAQIFASVEAFGRIGALAARSKAHDFARTACMYRCPRHHRRIFNFHTPCVHATEQSHAVRVASAWRVRCQHWQRGRWHCPLVRAALATIHHGYRRCSSWRNAGKNL
jgi:hypothetical protein